MRVRVCVCGNTDGDESLHRLKSRGHKTNPGKAQHLSIGSAGNLQKKCRKNNMAVEKLKYYMPYAMGFLPTLLYKQKDSVL